ncbi:MAG TPA: zinc ribbon domain-containing protein [Anaeromyxobacteraceae bacterium]|nr:zinc ribbon domain-containing protein [Anaeromyxobacteraceae bacterium]
MPIYEFVCEDCGRLTEVMQKLTDPPPAACPECGGSRMARTVSRTSFQLKGGGWYSDLYASPKEKPKAAAAGGDAKAGAEAKGGGEAKPAGSGSSAPGGSGGAKQG